MYYCFFFLILKYLLLRISLYWLFFHTLLIYFLLYNSSICYYYYYYYYYYHYYYKYISSVYALCSAILIFKLIYYKLISPGCNFFSLIYRLTTIWRDIMFTITWRLGNHSLWERNDFLEKGKTGLLLLYNKF